MPEKTRLAESPYFWPTAVLLSAAAVSLICWGVYNLLPQSSRGAEKGLQIAQNTPKFNHTSKEVSAAPHAAAPKPKAVTEPRHVTVAFAQGQPPLIAPPLEEMPPLLPPLPPIEPAQLLFPEPPAHRPAHVPDTKVLVYLESTPGETPMLRTWKTLALYSLLTSTVYVQVPAPARAQEIDGAAIKKSIEDLQKTLQKNIDDSIAGVKNEIKALRSDYETLKTAKDDSSKEGLINLNKKIEDIEGSLKSIRQELEALRRTPVAKSGIDKDSIEDIKKLLVNIDQAIRGLTPSGPGRISLASPVPTTPTTGRVVLINSYQEPLLFIINKRPYRVMPGVNQPIDSVPSGSLTYEVWADNWGMRAQNTTSLNPNETFTLTAR